MSAAWELKYIIFQCHFLFGLTAIIIPGCELVQVMRLKDIRAWFYLNFTLFMELARANTARILHIAYTCTQIYAECYVNA